jgi:hypothetical protein
MFGIIRHCDATNPAAPPEYPRSPSVLVRSVG